MSPKNITTCYSRAAVWKSRNFPIPALRPPVLSYFTIPYVHGIPFACHIFHGRQKTSLGASYVLCLHLITRLEGEGELS
jgi:hypothetical protein